MQAVLLFDPLNNDFDITYVLKHDSGSWEKVPIQAGTTEQSAGVLLSYKMVAYDKLQVKVNIMLLSLAYGAMLCACVGDSEAKTWVAWAISHFPVWVISYPTMYGGTNDQ